MMLLAHYVRNTVVQFFHHPFRHILFERKTESVAEQREQLTSSAISVTNTDRSKSTSC